MAGFRKPTALLRRPPDDTMTEFAVTRE